MAESSSPVCYANLSVYRCQGDELRARLDDLARLRIAVFRAWPYLYDGDTQATAKAYGCLATPHVFIFDADRKLRYKGRFDDSQYADPATVKSADTRKAVEALLAGEPVPVPIPKPHGCSTKWRSKQSGIALAKE